MAVPSPYFANVPGYGDLELEEILVDYDYPLLSVLISPSGQRFICSCYDVVGVKENVKQYWTVATVSNSDLIRLLHNQLSIHDVFVISDVKIIVSWGYRDKMDNYQFVDSFSEEVLLDTSDYLDSDTDEWDEYVEQLERVG